jgi:Fur family peroxide stress response transcriptional regulator
MQRAGTQIRSPRGKVTPRPVESAQLERMLTGVRAAGLKLTPQRLAIVRELAEDESHPTAQELFERLRPALPTMSFATVYNTLDALTTAGLCSALALAPGSGRFDPNMRPHHHLVCDGCGSVRDLPIAGSAKDPGPVAEGPSDPASGGAAAIAPEVASVRRAIARAAPGFEVRSVERILRGLCADCARGRSGGRGDRR